MAPLLTPFELQVRLPEPHTLIHVKNLHTTLPIGTDAWGRPAKQQPVLLTCVVSLRQPFSSAASTDSVTKSTVHYGILSKSLLEACKQHHELITGSENYKKDEHIYVKGLMDYVHWFLTGTENPQKSLNSNGENMVEGKVRELLLPPQTIYSLSITVHLPKASLVGQGISLSAVYGYSDITATRTHPETQSLRDIPYSMVLKIHDLRIHCLIGVNPNERLAKQIVVVNVEFERWNRADDYYVELEDVIVKLTSNSTFQTLEALSTYLSRKLIAFSISKEDDLSAEFVRNYPRIRIKLEKPTAVTFADAPAIEIVVDSDPEKSEVVM